MADFEYKALNTFFGAQQRSSLLDIIHRTKPNHLIPYPTPRIRDFFCCSSPCYGVSPRYGVSSYYGVMTRVVKAEFLKAVREAVA